MNTAELADRFVWELGRIESRVHLLPVSDQATTLGWVREQRDRLNGQGRGLGFLPLLIAGGVAVAGAVGAWLWKSHEQAVLTNRYLDCVERYESEGYTPEAAAKLCGKQGAIPSWVWLALAGVGVGLVIVFAVRSAR